MPLVQVRRCLAKILSLAERKATKTEVSVGRSEGPGDELFKTDDEFEMMIMIRVAQMGACLRSAQMPQANIWKRQAELAVWLGDRGTGGQAYPTTNRCSSGGSSDQNRQWRRPKKSQPPQPPKPKREQQL